MIKRFLATAFVVFLAFSAQAKTGLNIFAYPREAPDTQFYDANGNILQLADFKGDFLLVMFWSRYCAPCIRELDEINEFVKKTEGNGIKVLLISPRDEWKSIREQQDLLDKYGAPDVDFYLDERGNLAAAFGIFSSPHTVLISRSGEEIGRIRGTADWDAKDTINYIYKIKAEHG